jgi:hypothetical protein
MEIKSGEVESAGTTNVTINVSPFKGESIPDHSFILRSADDHSNSYFVPKTFVYPSINYPEVPNPEIIVETNGIDNAGITTFDLVTIQRHILQIDTLSNIQVLASDVNGSGSASASDLLSMRKVILSIQDNFSINKSYLSVLSACDIDPEQCIEAATIDTSKENQEINFTIIKYGDVR